MLVEPVMWNTGLLFWLALLLLTGSLAAAVSVRFGFPSLALFLVVGMILGSDVSGLIEFARPDIAQVIGIFALVVILFEGGLKTDLEELRLVGVSAGILATVGVVITTGVVGAAVWLLLDFTVAESFLLGATVGSTDAAAVFSLLQGKEIHYRTRLALEAESGLNDPAAIFLTVMAIELVGGGNPSAWIWSLWFLWQIVVGLGMGCLMGWLGLWTINRVNLGTPGLYSVLTFSLAVVTFAFTDALSASGFFAVYIFGIYLGNHPMVFRHSVIRFHEGTALLMQIVMFVLLGLLVFPGQLWSVLWSGLMIAFVLMIVARPAAVWICTAFQGFYARQKVFLAWAGLRGATPIILATFPFAAQLSASQRIFDVVFCVVLLSVVLQGSSISWLAGRLGLLTGARKREPRPALELIAFGVSHMTLVEVEVPRDSQAHGRTIRELDFPSSTAISAVVRGDELVPPRGDTRLSEGDVLFILAPEKELSTIKQRLRHRARPAREE